MAYQYDIEAEVSFMHQRGADNELMLFLVVDWHSPVTNQGVQNWVELVNYTGDRELDFYNDGFRIMLDDWTIKRKAANEIASTIRTQVGGGTGVLPLEIAKANFNDGLKKRSKLSLFIDLGLENQTGDK